MTRTLIVIAAILIAAPLGGAASASTVSQAGHGLGHGLHRLGHGLGHGLHRLGRRMSHASHSHGHGHGHNHSRRR